MANSLTLLETQIRIGDTVKVTYAYKDKDKEKTQLFEGIVLGVRGRETGKMVSIRKMTRSKIGVERIFPVDSPYIKAVEVVRKTQNTKAKVTYIRERSQRDIRERLYTR